MPFHTVNTQRPFGMMRVLLWEIYGDGLFMEPRGPTVFASRKSEINPLPKMSSLQNNNTCLQRLYTH